MQHDPGRAAYEARFAHARPRDVEPWDSLPADVKAIWARVEAACVAPIKAELDEAREEAELVRDDSGDQMRMLDAIAGKLGLAHDEGLEDAEPFLAKINRLLIAFHDAIRRPLGVTPDSGAEFYDPRMADEAEERRCLARACGRHAYQPHKLYPQCAQCGYPESETLMHLPADSAEKEQGGGSAA